MRCGHFTYDAYDPWIWLKVTSMASNRKSAKNPLDSGFLMIHSTFIDQDRSFCCQIIVNIIFSKFLMK